MADRDPEPINKPAPPNSIEDRDTSAAIQGTPQVDTSVVMGDAAGGSNKDKDSIGASTIRAEADIDTPNVDVGAGATGTARDVDYDPNQDIDELEDEAGGFADRSGLTSGQTTGGTTHTGTTSGATHPTISVG